MNEDLKSHRSHNSFKDIKNGFGGFRDTPRNLTTETKMLIHADIKSHHWGHISHGWINIRHNIKHLFSRKES